MLATVVPEEIDHIIAIIIPSLSRVGKLPTRVTTGGESTASIVTFSNQWCLAHLTMPCQREIVCEQFAIL